MRNVNPQNCINCCQSSLWKKIFHPILLKIPPMYTLYNLLSIINLCWTNKAYSKEQTIKKKNQLYNIFFFFYDKRLPDKKLNLSRIISMHMWQMACFWVGFIINTIEHIFIWIIVVCCYCMTIGRKKISEVFPMLNIYWHLYPISQIRYVAL